MKTIPIFSLLGLLYLCFVANKAASDILTIAHRGASGYLPENSLPAIAYAHALEPDFIEVDIQLTKDGYPVVIHDKHLDELSNIARVWPADGLRQKKRWVNDFSLQELHQLRFYERKRAGTKVYPERFSGNMGFHLATLQEVVAMVGELNRIREMSVGLIIELKHPIWYQARGQDMAAAVVSVLNQVAKLNYSGEIVLQSFDIEYIKELAGRDLKLPLYVLFAKNSWGISTSDYDNYWLQEEGLKDIATFAKGVGAPLSLLLAGKKASDLGPRVRELGLELNAYTVRLDKLPSLFSDPLTLYSVLLQKAKITGIISDQIDHFARFEHKLSHKEHKQ